MKAEDYLELPDCITVTVPVILDKKAKAALELYQQANKRLHRQGQTEKVIVHHIVVEGGVDEDVLAALEGKGDTQDRLMEVLKARIEKCKKDLV